MCIQTVQKGSKRIFIYHFLLNFSLFPNPPTTKRLKILKFKLQVNLKQTT